MDELTGKQARIYLEEPDGGHHYAGEVLGVRRTEDGTFLILQAAHVLWMPVSRIIGIMLLNSGEEGA